MPGRYSLEKQRAHLLAACRRADPGADRDPLWTALRRLRRTLITLEETPLWQLARPLKAEDFYAQTQGLIAQIIATLEATPTPATRDWTITNLDHIAAQLQASLDKIRAELR